MARPRHPQIAKWYVDYLASKHWQELRLHILNTRRRRCEDCRSRYKPTLHHLTYARLGMERDGDLRILCPKHHRHAHRWHDIPYLFLIYRENYECDVLPILRKARTEPDFEYPRPRAKKGTGGVG